MTSMSSHPCTNDIPNRAAVISAFVDDTQPRTHALIVTLSRASLSKITTPTPQREPTTELSVHTCTLPPTSASGPTSVALYQPAIAPCRRLLPLGHAATCSAPAAAPNWLPCGCPATSTTAPSTLSSVLGSCP